MNDILHIWASDLATNATGDLAVVMGTTLGQQRVLRRLLTNRGDYIWHTNYGAGLGGFVGSPANETQIMAIIRSQIFLEPAVAQTPAPVINVQISPADALSAVYVDIRYTDSSSGQTQMLTFSVSA